MGDQKPLVSVCIQTYQHADFIEECLNSVLRQQTDFPFEIIVGEDESSDGTREICKRYAEAHPDKIRLFLRSRKDVIYIDGNPTGRFNVVENLKAARGKYIALLEGDDYWTDPHKLQKQAEVLETKPGIVLCHHWHRYSSQNSEGNWEEHEAPKEGHGYLPQTVATVRDVFMNRLRCKSRTIFFRNLIDENFFPEWFRKVAYGDIPLTFLLGKHGDFFFMDEVMAVYRITGKGSSTAGIKNALFEMKSGFKRTTIWAYADSFYDGEYFKEAETSVVKFYALIFKKFVFNPKVFRLVCAHLFRLPGFSLKQKIVIFREVMKFPYQSL